MGGVAGADGVGAGVRGFVGAGDARDEACSNA
jgi:hypothetical protein